MFGGGCTYNLIFFISHILLFPIFKGFKVLIFIFYIIRFGNLIIRFDSLIIRFDSLIIRFDIKSIRKKVY